MGFKNVVKRWFKTKRNIMEFLFQWLGFWPHALDFCKI
jgi:hypothetical protein